MRHRNKLYAITSTMLLFVLLLGTSLSQAGPTLQNPAAPIRLGVATFVPALGEKPTIPPGLTIAGYAAGQRGYYIVQFAGPIKESWKEQVSATGAELLNYIPEFAFKVRMNPSQAHRVQELDTVVWVGLFHPAYKLSPSLVSDGTRMYVVRVERGVDAGLSVAAIVASGAQILSRKENILTVAADSAQLNAVARVSDVAWVENFMLKERHNEYAAGLIMGSNASDANGFDGSTQIVAVADTGLGGGDENSAHADIPASRISAIYNWVGTGSLGFYEVIDDGAKDVDIGHGTHVAVSVLGDGGPGGEGRGTAPGASLVFQAVENYVIWDPLIALLFGYEDGYYLVGLPADIRELFQEAYNGGARIHSNSWGIDALGAYTLDSSNADDFIWNHRDMAIIFSAGNSGIDTNGDGVIDNDSMGAPGTAKNVITVGASENDRQGNYPCDPNLTYTNCNDQNYLFTYGEAWPGDYPADPIASDLSAGNAEQMAAFSSRGPTDDGRIKPDVVAPGTWILSGYSDLYQQGYDSSTNPQNNAWQYDGWGYPLSEYYKYMGGTSMSAPLVSGAGAVVRDFFQKEHLHNASGALVKATLINTAVDLLDENNDGVDDNDYPIPNYHEGWGRVNLAKATDGTLQFVDESTGLNTGDNFTNYYNISSGGPTFKVTLVWTDYPSSESASKNLVNDLDLIVISPGGTTYLGNVFNSGWSTGGGNTDRSNNVENVYVESAEQGTWTVEVVGYNIPYGPQPFALVVDAELNGGDNPPNTSIVDPVEGQTVNGNYHVLVSASDDSSVVKVELSIDGGIFMDITENFDGTHYSYEWDTTSHSNGNHTLRSRATDDATQSTESVVVNVIVDNEPMQSVVHVANLETGLYEVTGKGRNRTAIFTAGEIFTAGDSVVIRAYVVDAGNDQPLANATMDIAITGPENIQLTTEPSDNSGMAEVTWKTRKPNKKGRGGTTPGLYTATVTNVISSGYTWDGASTSKTFSIQ